MNHARAASLALATLAAAMVAACDPRGSTGPSAPGSIATVPAGPTGVASSATAPQPITSSAPVIEPPPAGPGKVMTTHFQSASLGVQKNLVVYLPAGYEASSRRYPVIYLLHGLGGNETNWIKYGKLPETADAMHLQAIVVMPDGDDGFYANWATPSLYEQCLNETPPFDKGERAETYCVKTPRYEDYIVKDILGYVDATYRTVADRKGRAIAGLSMGGLGALELALRHKDLFAEVASHSGVVAPLYAGPHPFAPGKAALVASASAWGSTFPDAMREHVRRVYGADLANWRAHDPTVLAHDLKDGELRVYVDCGTEDGFKLQDEAAYLHEILDAGKVQHAFALVPGPHHFDLWKERIKESLAFLAKGF